MCLIRVLRYVDITQFAFHVLQLLLIVLTQLQNLCYISKFTIKHHQNKSTNQTYHDGREILFPTTRLPKYFVS